MRRKILMFWFAVGSCIGLAQETRILSFRQDGTLTWTNSHTNVFCGLEYMPEQLGTYWATAPGPFWNILVTGAVMSVELPMSEIEDQTLFFRLISSTNPLVRGDAYDVDARGLPQFVKSDYIEPGKIERISRFRSGVGHDYSDDFESCRSMKHYFQPSNTVDWASLQIRSPVDGFVSSLRAEWAGTAIEIRSSESPAFWFTLFHVQAAASLSLSDRVSAGQFLGTHVGNQTMSDIAVEVKTPTGLKLVSYFDVMTDSLFATYQARGLNSRTNAIISKEARDSDLLSCNGETFEGPGNLANWFTLQ